MSRGISQLIQAYRNISNYYLLQGKETLAILYLEAADSLQSSYQS